MWNRYNADLKREQNFQEKISSLNMIFNQKVLDKKLFKLLRNVVNFLYYGFIPR